MVHQLLHTFAASHTLTREWGPLQALKLRHRVQSTFSSMSSASPSADGGPEPTCRVPRRRFDYTRETSVNTIKADGSTMDPSALSGHFYAMSQ